VSDREWQGRGPEFTLKWGGREWTLNLGSADPGLRPIGGVSPTKLLCLDGLAQAGRFDPNAFNSTTLVGFERHRDRVQAVFAPIGWGGLLVRAAWSPTPEREGVDLEIQIGATSVGELQGLEVGVVGDCRGPIDAPESALANWVEPRDAASAALSYDGRESSHKLRAFSTLPLPAASPSTPAPWIRGPLEHDPDLFYIEMVQPNDAARRIMVGPIGARASSRSALSVRYALFGHDVEKGVILRARLRGLWIRSKSPEHEAEKLLAEFLREPVPLGP
jgi:hypothetical protein